MLYSYVLDFREHEFKRLARICNYTMLFIIERNMIDIFHTTLDLTSLPCYWEKDPGSLICLFITVNFALN